MKFSLPFSRYVVDGHSMEPSFIRGDRVLVWKRGTVQPRDVVVLRHCGRDYIKRITAVTPAGYHVQGDNKEHGTSLSPIPRSHILGKVVMTY